MEYPGSAAACARTRRSAQVVGEQEKHALAARRQFRPDERQIRVRAQERRRAGAHLADEQATGSRRTASAASMRSTNAMPSGPPARPSTGSWRYSGGSEAMSTAST